MRRELVVLCLIGCALGAWGVYQLASRSAPENRHQPAAKRPAYHPRKPIDTSGLAWALASVQPWRDPADLRQIRDAFVELARRPGTPADRILASSSLDPFERMDALLAQASRLTYLGQPTEAYQVLEKARNLAKSSPELEEVALYTVVFFQGVAALRQGENDNCLECRGQGACIFPIRPAAVHTRPDGSRLAIRHFTEYLEQFPDDPGVRWLLNLAFMTLGEHPRQVPGAYLMRFDGFGAESTLGPFEDVAHLVGVNRFNQAGGAIMDDFDNDGLLDLIVTSFDPAQSMAFFRNKGDGTFEERTREAGLSQQLGGLNCVQADYDNDGFLDVFVPRGAWHTHPMRPSLLRNNGDGTFTDVTRAAGLMDSLNSISATWADYDNDGHLDLFVCNEMGLSRLYRNKGDGTFEEVAARAGVQGKERGRCKGAAWIDYDNDGYPDLFLNYLGSTPQLFRNNRDGTFTEVTAELGITGPNGGFSCWAFDYDNDGWPDLFATCYQRTLSNAVRGMKGDPITDGMDVTRLYRNLGGKRFQDVSKEAGVDRVFVTMGSNFADFDNDGYLDFYLGTGEPDLSTLTPNRMFRNLAGKRFADVTVTSRTGHLQKGHGVACGDWDRNGTVDLFMEVGGAVPGDRYHNVLFQNLGPANSWLNVKLIGAQTKGGSGKKTNRAAIGARIKVVTAGKEPLTVYRHVSSGSSFGANPLEQHVGLGNAGRVARLEIYWPTSGTTQVFHDVAVNQGVVITELAGDYQTRSWKPIRLPK